MTKPTVLLRRTLASILVASASPHAIAQFDVGLVSYWPFDGDLLDATATGAHGVFIDPFNNPPVASFIAGKFGLAINLNDFTANAFEQYVEITGVPEDTFDFVGGSMTVSAWVATPLLTIDGQAIVSKGITGTWSLARDGGTNLTPAFQGGLGATAAAADPGNPAHYLQEDPAPVDVASAPIVHVVGVVEAGLGIRVYVNGQLAGSVSGNAQLAGSPFNLAIGGNPEADTEFLRTWEGSIDDVAIWNRVLSAGEIATIYNNGTGVSIANILNPVDTDGDGMPDFYENSNGLDPNTNDAGGDLDGDGRTNIQEFQDGTNPQNSDSDGDGLTDGEEFTAGTNPNSPDSDGDRLTDGEELNGTLNPFSGGILGDPPGDPTNPLEADSDGDGFDDRTEIDFKSDPNNAADAPSSWQIGLRGYWPLVHADWVATDPDPALRTFEDASGRGFHGTLAGTNITSLQSYAGPFGKNVTLLDGTDQRVTISGDPGEFDFPGGDFSVSAWFVTPAWSKSWQAIVAKGEGDNWRVHRNGGGTNLAFTGGEPDIAGGPKVDDFKWHHVLATTSGTQKNLYIDGTLVASGAQDPLGSNGQPMMIGGNPDTAGDNFRTPRAALADVAVWGRALSTDEVRSIWNNFDNVARTGGATIAQLIEGIDSDGDGMPDVFEDANGLNKNANDAAGDLDGDGLTNKQEYDAGTDPRSADPDGDGLSDPQELALGTDPYRADTDSDGLNDQEEVTGSQNPYLGGTFRETFDPLTQPGDPTDPFNPDSDGDTILDGAEVFQGSNPNDPASVPLVQPVLYYKFDDQNPTTVANFGSLPADGIVTGGLTYTDSMRPELGKAFLGNRTGANNAYVNTSYTGTELGLAGQSYTATALIRWDGPAGGEDHMIFAQTRTNDALHHGIRANGGGVNDGHFGHWGNDVNNAGTFTPGQWQHVAYSYLNGSATVHLDGVQVGTATVGALNATGAAEIIVIGFTGRDGNAHGSFNGAIDEVKIMNRALNAAEILAEAERALGLAAPAEVILTDIAFNGAALEVTADNLAAGRQYILRRATDGLNFTDVGASFTGGTTHTFVDPSPPVGKALYQIWEVGP